MADYFEVRGTRETFQYEGRVITIWKMITSQGRTQRRYHLKIDQQEIAESFPTRQAALGRGRYLIELSIRSAWFEERMRAHFEPNHPSTPSTGGDRNARLKEHLKNWTAERGCNDAEIEAAKRKLAELDGKST